MVITPLAAESMGTRSMATSVETGDSKMIIDPWISRTGLRAGLEPHKVEKWHAEKLKSRIQLFLKSAEVIIITQYDDATFSLLTEENCRDKTIFMKNPNQNTRGSHRNDAFLFIRRVRPVIHDVIFAEGKSLKLGNTKLQFAETCISGCEDTEGQVMPLMISDPKSSFIYSSGVAGILNRQTADFIKEHMPSILYLDGPETLWREGDRAREELDTILQTLIENVIQVNLELIILDHHIMRDSHWREKCTVLFKIAEDNGITIKSAAEFRGEKNNLLEGRRRSLFDTDPAP